MNLFTGTKFDLVWLGEIKEDGTEISGHTVASEKTLDKLREIAGKNKITDFDHRIDEIGYELISGIKIETVVSEHKIKAQ